MTQVKGFALRGLFKSLKEHGWSIPEVLARLPESTAGQTLLGQTS